ncbi:hypothetical protein HYFRA_00012972 [Hymenoscyphus fraxineus]|uniref:Uncharacterized protein n=1 Tax=Hymenoscyphus fraxineus TaxID=746836 RepID=A0A9N9L4U9_9HELO|nr:hypothetical protein HYFRA_00012972 [Hymenoscyphus fraxineus]
MKPFLGKKWKAEKENGTVAYILSTVLISFLVGLRKAAKQRRGDGMGWDGMGWDVFATGWSWLGWGLRELPPQPTSLPASSHGQTIQNLIYQSSPVAPHTPPEGWGWFPSNGRRERGADHAAHIAVVDIRGVMVSRVRRDLDGWGDEATKDQAPSMRYLDALVILQLLPEYVVVTCVRWLGAKWFAKGGLKGEKKLGNEER